jgi:general secretion pathway protein D
VTFKHLAAAMVVALGLFSQPLQAKEITLNFKDADIRAVIEFVSAFSGKNFLVDNRVKGKVTIISPTPIPEDQAYDVFLSVLEVNGFVAVPSGSVVKVLPRAEGKQRPLPVTQKGATGDAMVTRVLRLQHADAQQVLTLLTPLISPNSNLTAYPAGNMLLLTDSAANIERIRKILALVDREDALTVRLFTLKYASADKLANTLTSLYAEPGRPNQSSHLKVMAMQPGNTLIAVAPPQLLSEIDDVIRRLDVQPEHDSGSLQVRYLKHANAEDVAKVLNELIGRQGAAPANHGKQLFAGDVKIVADPATNALLITADPADIQSVDSIIDKLDIRRLQVLIEALIVEVSGNDAEQLGIDWMANQAIRNGPNTVTGGQNLGGGIGAANALGNQIQNNTPAANLPSGLNIGVLHAPFPGGAISLGAVVQALQTTGDANILSTPNILTMDNESAEIVVGQNVPFVTGTNATQGGTAVPFQTIERKDIGLTLKVTPQISEGDTVRLEIYQEVSSISNTAVQTGASDIITNKRSVKTVTLAKDRQMLVLGGLMREDNSTTVRRVPCIGAVPIIGEPFQSTANSRTKTNLMIFLRPTIVRSDDDIQTVTQEKYLDIRNLYEHPAPKGTILFPRPERKLPLDMRPNGGTAGTGPATTPVR